MPAHLVRVIPSLRASNGQCSSSSAAFPRPHPLGPRDGSGGLCRRSRPCRGGRAAYVRSSTTRCTPKPSHGDRRLPRQLLPTRRVLLTTPAPQAMKACRAEEVHCALGRIEFARLLLLSLVNSVCSAIWLRQRQQPLAVVVCALSGRSRCVHIVHFTSDPPAAGSRLGRRSRAGAGAPFPT